MTLAVAQGAFLSKPYINLHRGADRPQEYAGGTLLLSLALALGGAALMAVAAGALALGGAPAELTGALLAAAAALPFVLLRDCLRQYLFAGLELRRTLLLDGAWVGLQLAGVAWLYASGSLTAGTVFAPIGGAALITSAAGVWWLRAGFRFSAEALRGAWAMSWRFGLWTTLSELCQQSRTHLVQWLLVLLQGLHAAGALAAALAVVRIVNPLLLSLSNVGEPHLARAYAEGGARRVQSIAWKMSVLAGAALAPICVCGGLAGAGGHRAALRRSAAGGRRRAGPGCWPRRRWAWRLIRSRPRCMPSVGRATRWASAWRRWLRAVSRPWRSRQPGATAPPPAWRSPAWSLWAAPDPVLQDRTPCRNRPGGRVKVLLVHNYYQKLGGEDVSVNAEADLLESRGHEVFRYTRHSQDIASMPGWKIAAGAVWSPRTYLEVRGLIKSVRPDVLHCTNNFPLISPSVYEAAAVEEVPVVQALRNYRSLCANACFYRDGGPCERCLAKRLAWPGVVNACYKSSRAASAIYLAWQSVQRAAASKIARYYTLTEFARGKFLAGGFDPARIDVKPNFIDPDPGLGARAGGYAMFAGRLSPEKGVNILLDAWRMVGERGLLKIVGDGPDQPLVHAAIAEGVRCEYVGQQSPLQVLEIAGDAAFVVMSSTVYETFGRTVIEAYSRGVPVIVPRSGALSELGHDRLTGLCFEPGDAKGAGPLRDRAAGKPIPVPPHGRGGPPGVRAALHGRGELPGLALHLQAGHGERAGRPQRRSHEAAAGGEPERFRRPRRAADPAAAFPLTPQGLRPKLKADSRPREELSRADSLPACPGCLGRRPGLLRGPSSTPA